jgi:hypothetical protein
MVQQASLQWKRLRRYIAADPARFAGDPFHNPMIPYTLVLYQADHGRNPSAADMPSAAAVPGGA